MRKHEKMHNTPLILVVAGSDQDPKATSDYYIAEEGTGATIPAY